MFMLTQIIYSGAKLTAAELKNNQQLNLRTLS
ncbi:hypothetical protein N574_01435 [Lactiplantibacillus plantarum 2165]|nr:hypothetical protein N574_01435 [Lactiplantibacillus plantarum 2165]CDN27330.1 hypothetical protein predicted by Glimmer/Critica [Lactiplantibacillus plantarum]